MGYDAAMPVTMPEFRAFLSPGRRQLLGQFARFCVVGLAGAAVDIGTVYLLMGAVGLYAAGMLAWVAAVTTTWALNRAWTFAAHEAPGGMLRQWAVFVAANSLGFVLNRGTFVVLVATVPFCAAHPVVPVMAGVLAGLFVNFTMSRRVVFRAHLALPD